MFCTLFEVLRKARLPGIQRRRAAFSILLAPTLLLGCGGFPATIPISGPATPSSPSAPTINNGVTAKNIYSIDLGNQTVDVYAADLNGTASPTSSYTGSARAVTGDSAGNIYIGTYSSTLAAVQVYAPGASISTRSITVATAATNAPQVTTLASDSTGNLYVAISNSIYVYGPNAAGNATPIRTISGTLTSLTASVSEMAFDSSDNLFVVTDPNQNGPEVIEFAAGASGNVAPTVITSSVDYFPTGVALDAANNIYIVQSNSPSAGSSTHSPAIYVFPKGSVAGASPSRIISGSNIGISLYTSEIFVDSGGNIFVGAVLNGQTDFLVYSATANGNAAPASQLIRSKGSSIDEQFFVK
jgi:hypothetical protein